MTILTVGINLAKNVFAELLRPAVPRAKLLALIAALPPCVIAMEACSGAHNWARQFPKFGHTVRQIAPKFVTPVTAAPGAAARTTPPTPPRSARPPPARTCGSCPSRARSSNSNSRCTAPASWHTDRPCGRPALITIPPPRDDHR